MIERLAWVTTSAARGEDDDEPLALPALAEAGVAVEVLDWDDDSVAWADYDRVVLRSVWDYPERLTEFVAWLDHVEEVTDLRNPAHVVRWSLDKHYLSELSAAGVSITTTVFVEPDDEPVFPETDFVVKPAVGAGSRDASSYLAAQIDQAREHVARLQARGVTALVQPLLKSVAVEGELPMLFFGGRFSHAASKRVSLPQAGVIEGLFAEEINSPAVATEQQIAVASAAIDCVTARFGTLTYARVDLVNDDDGQPCVMEVELVEPSLFLPQSGPEAVSRLVESFTA